MPDTSLRPGDLLVKSAADRTLGLTPTPELASPIFYWLIPGAQVLILAVMKQNELKTTRNVLLLSEGRIGWARDVVVRNCTQEPR